MLGCFKGKIGCWNAFVDKCVVTEGVGLYEFGYCNGLNSRSRGRSTKVGPVGKEHTHIPKGGGFDCRCGCKELVGG